MKKGLIIGLISAMISAGIIYVLSSINMPKELITAVAAAIAWISVWLGGKTV